jgi:hypothetical protein
MPGRGAIFPPKRNTGFHPGPWKQSGYTYGVNDAGAYQDYFEVGYDWEIDADYEYWLTTGWTVSVKRMTHQLSRLEAHAGWNGGTDYVDEVLMDFWELDPQETDKGLLEADFPFGSVNMNDQSRLAVKAALADPNPNWVYWGWAHLAGQLDLSNDVTYQWHDNTSVSRPPNLIICPYDDYAAAYSLYRLMSAGVSEFPVEGSIIKHTMMCSNLYTPQVAYSRVNRLISNDTMINYEGMPSGLLFSLPDLPTPTQFVETPLDLQYGWRKMRPSVTRLAAFKWRLVQNYQLGLWPIQLFGSVL